MDTIIQVQGLSKACISGLSPQKHRKQLFEQVEVQFQEADYPNRVGELFENVIRFFRGEQADGD